MSSTFSEKEKIKNETRINVRDKKYFNRDGNKKEKVCEADQKATQYVKLNTNKSNNDKKFLTYSGLLNAMDGVMSNQILLNPYKCIHICRTINHYF